MEVIEIKKHYLSDDLARLLVKQGVLLQSDNNGYYINGWTTSLKPEDEYFNSQRIYLCWWEKGNSEPVGICVHHNQIK